MTNIPTCIFPIAVKMKSLNWKCLKQMRHLSCYFLQIINLRLFPWVLVCVCVCVWYVFAMTCVESVLCLFPPHPPTHPLTHTFVRDWTWGFQTRMANAFYLWPPFPGLYFAFLWFCVYVCIYMQNPEVGLSCDSSEVVQLVFWNKISHWTLALWLP